jgi:hypothetical protein
MARKKPSIPAELDEFIKNGNTTFHAKEGDWDILIQADSNSPVRYDLPLRSTVIAENGSGDYLFLRTTPAGKLDPKVYVYWHEEGNHEVFAKRLKELIFAKPRPHSEDRGAPAKARPRADLAASKKLEATLSSTNATKRAEAMRDFAKTEFGLEALPTLRRALADGFVSVVIAAAECIGRLGSQALNSPAGQKSMPVDLAEPDNADLEEQLMLAGSKVWSYSGYANSYSSCLRAMVSLGVDEDIVLEYVQSHVGLSSPDDLICSLEALQKIGTADARDLAKRAAAFWMPELNLTYAKKAKAVLTAAAGKKRK